MLIVTICRVFFILHTAN